MSPERLTEETLRASLRSELEGRVGPHPAWQASPAEARSTRRRPPANRLLVAAAVILGAGAIGLVVVGGGIERQRAVTPSTAPSIGPTSSNPVASPSMTPSPTASLSQVVNAGMTGQGSGWALVDRLSAGAVTRRDLLVTSDGGATWSSHAWPFPFEDGPVMSSPDVGWYLEYVTAANGSATAELHRTADAGTSWSSVALPSHRGEPQLPSFAPGGTGYLVTSTGSHVGDRGPGGSLLVTNDRGTTWQHRSDLPTGTTGDLVALSDRDLVLRGSTADVVGKPLEDVLMTSHDGGRTWTSDKVFDELGSVSIRGMGEDGAVMLVQVGDGPTVFRVSTDGARSWTTTGSAAGVVGRAAFSPVDRLVWYADVSSPTGPPIGLSETEDAGRTWHPVVASGLPEVARFEVLSFADVDHGWGLVTVDSPGSGSRAGGLFATDDGGRTWRPLSLGA